MPITITLNIVMSYRCKKHTDIELSVFQPTNSSSYVEPCIACVREKDNLHNKIEEFKSLVEVRQKEYLSSIEWGKGRIERLENDLKIKQGEINKTKRNLRKGGKK